MAERPSGSMERELERDHCHNTQHSGNNCKYLPGDILLVFADYRMLSICIIIDFLKEKIEAVFVVGLFDNLSYQPQNKVNIEAVLFL